MPYGNIDTCRLLSQWPNGGLKCFLVSYWSEMTTTAS